MSVYTPVCMSACPDVCREEWDEWSRAAVGAVKRVKELQEKENNHKQKVGDGIHQSSPAGGREMEKEFSKEKAWALALPWPRAWSECVRICSGTVTNTSSPTPGGTRDEEAFDSAQRRAALKRARVEGSFEKTSSSSKAIGTGIGGGVGGVGVESAGSVYAADRAARVWVSLLTTAQATRWTLGLSPHVRCDTPLLSCFYPLPFLPISIHIYLHL